MHHWCNITVVVKVVLESKYIAILSTACSHDGEPHPSWHLILLGYVIATNHV